MLALRLGMERSALLPQVYAALTQATRLLALINPFQLAWAERIVSFLGEELSFAFGWVLHPR